MDPEDLDPTKGGIKEDTGSTQRPPEDGLSSHRVRSDMEPSQHIQETPWEDSQRQERTTHTPAGLRFYHEVL